MVDKSEKVVWAARLGYMVRGLVYALFGYLALASGHVDEATAGTQGSLEYLQDIPGGSIVLYVCAAGLLGYAIYKLIAAVLDTEDAGDGVEGYVRRIGWVASFLIYCLLAWTALKLAIGMQSDTGGSTRGAVETAFSLGVGPVVIGVVGLAMLIAAADQFRRAWTASFMKRMSRETPSMACHIGRIGFAARGVVFMLVGWSMVRSGWLSDSGEVRSVGQALLDLRSMDAAFMLVAAGLIFFGAFSMITARYQIIRDPAPR
jgi:Domain of Unknown Function (DUF1206).